MRFPHLNTTSLQGTTLVVIGAHYFCDDFNDPLCRYVANVAWSRAVLVEASPEIAAALTTKLDRHNPLTHVPRSRISVVNQGVCFSTPINATTHRTFYSFAEKPGLLRWASQIGSFSKSHVEKSLKEIYRKQARGYNYSVQDIKSFVRPVQIECLHPVTLLQRQQLSGRIGVLTVDTEGQDCEIMRNLNWSSPELCALNPEVLFYEKKACIARSYLASAEALKATRDCRRTYRADADADQYELVYMDGENVGWARGESRELSRRMRRQKEAASKATSTRG
jgi:hypothetical protein